VLDWHPHVGPSDSNNFVDPGILQNYISYSMNATCRFGMQVRCTIVDNVCPATFGGVNLVRVTEEDILI